MTAFGWATSRQIQLKAPSLPSPTNVQGENDSPGVGFRIQLSRKLGNPREQAPITLFSLFNSTNVACGPPVRTVPALGEGQRLTDQRVPQKVTS